ncbi:cysteine-rich CWC family protein [Vibrio sp.]|nr:cysteine-rich CWC family protein [Vibrio sp.]
MKIHAVAPDPLICPICGKANHCVNLGAADVEKTCWCNDPNITFPEALLSKIPPDKRHKACVCKACALEYQKSNKCDSKKSESQ